MAEPKISVIIPVYNTAGFLDKCVSSVLEQSLREIELILIDDGSSDGSYEKCLEYARRDSRVTAAQQQHLRASAARNNGLRRARGEYIMFVDSDDYLAQDALDMLWQAVSADDLDAVRASLCIEENGIIRPDTRRERLPEEIMDGASFFHCAVTLGAYSCSVVTGLYRRSMIEQNSLYFLEGQAFEDELWMPLTLLACRRMRYINCCMYCHVMHDASVMHSKDTDRMGREQVNVARELAKVKNVPAVCERVWCDNLLGKYFSGFCIGRMYRRECRGLVSKTFPFPYVRSVKNALRSLIYFMNYRLFVTLNQAGMRANRARGVVRS